VVEWRAQGEDAREAGDFARCEELYRSSAAQTKGWEQASDLYLAARCAVRANRTDDGLRLVAEALEAQPGIFPLVVGRRDLALLHESPAWAALIEKQGPRFVEHERKTNSELKRLFEEDQADRHELRTDAPFFSWLDARDRARQARVEQILASGRLMAPEDFYHAALVLQHAHGLESYRRAHDLCMRALAIDPTYGLARRLAAAATDRYLTNARRPQRFGTQSHNHNGRWELFPVDPQVSDAERASWGLPSLATQRANVEAMNRSVMTPPSAAPPSSSAAPSQR
jgi:tetratricopeptide (TPR) repeat protein